MQWNSVKNKLPDLGKIVLVSDNKGLFWSAYYDYENEQWESILKLDANCAFFYKDIPQEWYVYWTYFDIQPERLNEKTSKDDAIV